MQQRILKKLFSIREKLSGIPIFKHLITKDAHKRFYTKMQKTIYAEGTTDHLEHNKNPLYNDLLLSPIKSLPIEQVTALDFGCGQGRNIENIWQFDEKVKKVDGVDISQANCLDCKKRFEGRNTEIYQNQGQDAACLPSESYDFVMSTIVLQHIPVHTIRHNLLKDIYRSMKKGGVFALQMGYGEDLKEINNTGTRFSYESDNWEVSGTNGTRDVRVTDSKQLTGHLESLGFKIIRTEIKEAFNDDGHPNWIYVHAQKA